MHKRHVYTVPRNPKNEKSFYNTKTKTEVPKEILNLQPP